jgi:hypothetical protein
MKKYLSAELDYAKITRDAVGGALCGGVGRI